MTDVVRPIGTGWVVTGRVPGPDVDEFAETDQVIAALADQDSHDSLLAVQHPNHTPRAMAAGLSLPEALPAAQRMLDRLLAKAYRRVDNIVAPYLATGPDGTALGMLCLVDPAAMDDDGQARIRQAEQVYPEVVAERAAVLAGLGCATSAAMLVPVSEGAVLTEALRRAIEAHDAPDVHVADSSGRQHQLWLLGPGRHQDELINLAQRHPLLVADGNHRMAAATGARSALLALITGGPALQVGAIHRMLVGTGLSADDLADAWRNAGLDVREADPPTATAPDHPGKILALAGDRALVVTLPAPRPDEPLPRIDHGVVEYLLIGAALGIDPAGPLVRALPEETAPVAEADAVLLVAPVPYHDVLAVHDQGRRMPRKSTYFTPKPRSGLLLAGLA
ncbi:MAG TPA: DUF1015 family protein [Pseudonocardiaceae bacterium]|jgi:hypothetical protein|nr:DUF1015 family protein [Pseudonocardiaceae bacterium]